MQLNAKERLTLPNLLPTNGNYHELITVRELTDLVKISTEEEKELGIVRNPEGRIMEVDEKKSAIEVGFDFTAGQTELVAKELREFEKKGHLNMDILGLFEKFVGVPEEPVTGEKK